MVRYCAFFFMKLVLVYVLLWAAWSFLGGAYGGVYRASANVVFTDFSARARAEFSREEDPNDRRDTRLAITNRLTGARKQVSISSFEAGYQPMAILIALVLASPINWARRLRVLLAGSVLVQIYSMASLGVLLSNKLLLDPLLRVASPSAWDHAVSSILLGTLAGWPITCCFVPVVTCLLLGFRGDDWNRLRMFATGASPASGPFDGSQDRVRDGRFVRRAIQGVVPGGVHVHLKADVRPEPHRPRRCPHSTDRR